MSARDMPSPDRPRRPRAPSGFILLLASTLGCSLDLSFGPSGISCAGFWGCGPGSTASMPYSMSPPGTWLLTGDTLRVVTSFCLSAAFGCDVGRDTGNAKSTWSVEPDTAIAPATALGAPSTYLILKMRKPGTARVRARMLGDTTRTVSQDYFVADSSAISELLVIGLAHGEMRAGESRLFEALLRDSSLRTFRAQPTSWSVSDTNVVAIERRTLSEGIAGVSIRARAAGSAELRAHFRTLAASVVVTVAP